MASSIIQFAVKDTPTSRKKKLNDTFIDIDNRLSALSNGQASLLKELNGLENDILSIKGDVESLLICCNKTPTIGTLPTGFTQGSVIFAGPGGFLTEDNANFFWDDDNDILKVSDVIVNSLTASKIVATDGDKKLVSIASLSSWIAGTTNQIAVTDDGDGTVTLSTPQDIHTGASPTFSGLTLSGIAQGSVLFAGVGGAVSENNTAFSWDNTLSQLSLYRNNSNVTPQISVEQDGSGDACATFSFTGGNSYTLGIDNSLASDPFRISPGSSLGAVSGLLMSTLGDFGFGIEPSSQFRVSYAQELENVNGRWSSQVQYVQTTTSLGDWSGGGQLFQVRAEGNNFNIGVIVGQQLNVKCVNTAGSISRLRGMAIAYGPDTGFGATSIVSNCYGLYLEPLYRGSGTVTRFYDLYINAPLTGSTVTNEWSIYNLHDAPSRFIGEIRIAADNRAFKSGAGDDMSMYYDGTAGNIDTDLVVPSDLVIDCGTDKTIELEETVWRDLQFPISGARVPASNAPTWEALTTNHNAYSFDVGDLKDQEDKELPHWWKEGTDGKVHLHLSTKTAQTTGSDRYAQFTVYVAYLNSSSIWTETSFTAELTIPTGTSAVQGFFLSVGTISLTGLSIGTQIGCRVERIAATGGTEYADRMFVTQAGIHLEQNTLGSRQEGIK